MANKTVAVVTRWIEKRALKAESCKCKLHIFIVNFEERDE